MFLKIKVVEHQNMNIKLGHKSFRMLHIFELIKRIFKRFALRKIHFKILRLNFEFHHNSKTSHSAVFPEVALLRSSYK